ncbi:MAG: aminodeoxychorismate lyase [Chloroflexota bacterium]|nr:endolytic transglycosylase MltG [Chloroflexota bacterium]NOG64758.1 endolytic transglycosylase MltG [Chloroflexota bacterium]GIK66244.1 MAG: aminodeoxychorismate lyase [Chloroflexota bacterium]
MYEQQPYSDPLQEPHGVSVRTLGNVLRAILIPGCLGFILLCVVVSFFVVITTPEGYNPVEGMAIRLYLVRNRDELNSPIGTDPTLKRFEVREGESANDIGINLVTAGFIRNGSLFARYARFQGMDDDLRPGVFFISETMTYDKILEVLTDPTPTTARFLVRENMRMEEIAAQIDATPLLSFTGAEFLAVVGPSAILPNDFRARYGIPSNASLEGFLYPATYELTAADTAVSFRDQMLTAFDTYVTQDLRDAAALQGKTMFEIVTLASIIEREAVLASERPTIASVYLNRLSIGQKLDADPTVQYQLANNRRDGVWWPLITADDYVSAVGPYNTYLNVGLPPGPIVNPSLSSIRAAIYPATTTYFYFRAACNGDGSHQFSTTFEEHIAKSCP